MIFLLSLFIFSALFYLYVIKPHNYWRNKNVKYDKPMVFFGSMWDFVSQRMAFYLKVDQIYIQHEGERYCGMYQFLKPVLFIRDPELIKTISIKEFDSFANHDIFGDDDIDPLWTKNLFSSTGEQWHFMRSVLSPSFTSSKLKMMFSLITDCAEQTAKHFLENKDEVLTLEMKDLYSRVSNDIIATCAMGVNCNSIAMPDNDVYKHSLAMADFKGLNVLRVLGYSISPLLMKIFNIKIFPTRSSNFFRKVIKDTVHLRTEKNIVRPDMIHLMLKARDELKQDLSLNDNIKNNKTKKNFQITEEDMTAQALIFLLGGLETASTLLSFLSYELALNKDIQDRLFKEIKTTSNQSNGKPSYDELMGMKYFDLVVTEALRKWPTMTIVSRTCTKDFVVPPTSSQERPLFIKKGDALWYSIYSIHRDVKYFSEPERFDPERFNDENKDKILPNTFVPFGIGPRNCIGARFTLLKIKAILFNLLKEFEFVPVEKTEIPVKISNQDFHIAAAGGMWLGFKKRN